MNYFAHGIRFRDRPWFLVGTAVPDWLGVADRKVRLRRERLEPHATGEETPKAELAAGVLQHLDDDGWFHGTEAFARTTTEITALFRRALGSNNGHRPWFLGHIATELLLDGLLAEEEPARLDDYYATLGRIDPADVERRVNSMTRRSTDRLARFIDVFLESEFLRDYADAGRLRLRLNQVLQRVRLKPLPPEIEKVLEAARPVVRQNMTGLLRR